MLYYIFQNIRLYAMYVGSEMWSNIADQIFLVLLILSKTFLFPTFLRVQQRHAAASQRTLALDLYTAVGRGKRIRGGGAY